MADRARCKPFLINLSAELIRRFPVDNDLWKKTAALNLTKAIDNQLRVPMPSLKELSELPL